MGWRCGSMQTSVQISESLTWCTYRVLKTVYWHRENTTLNMQTCKLGLCVSVALFRGFDPVNPERNIRNAILPLLNFYGTGRLIAICVFSMHWPDRGGATPQRCPLSVVGGNVEWAWGEGLLSPGTARLDLLGEPAVGAGSPCISRPRAEKKQKQTKTKAKHRKVKESTHLRKRPILPENSRTNQPKGNPTLYTIPTGKNPQLLWLLVREGTGGNGREREVFCFVLLIPWHVDLCSPTHARAGWYLYVTC